MGSTSIRRKGASLVESLILIIVVVISLGAIFASINFGLRTYSFGRQDLESRKLLFTWYQTFESVWPPPGHQITPKPGPGALATAAQGQIEVVANMLGAWHNGRAIIRGYSVQAEPAVVAATGVLNVTITIRSGERVLVDSIVRTFNTFSGDTVGDTTGS